MILSGLEISELVERTKLLKECDQFDPVSVLGRPSIDITPFDRSQLNPHSYNLRLGKTLLTYAPTDGILDMRREEPTQTIEIGPEGALLLPGTLYLGYTVERVAAYGLAPKIDGRSSIGRLGLLIHLTAGYGDSGFDGHYTLELSVVQPLRVYAGVQVCQISFEGIHGRVRDYTGKYHNQEARPVPSRLWRELQKETT